MEYSVFVATRPGDHFLVGDVEKVALARVPYECLLFTDGSTVSYEEVGNKTCHNTEDIKITPNVYNYLAEKLEFLVAPNMSNLVAGDYILHMTGEKVVVLTVAFVDAQRKSVYDQDGRVITLDDPNVIRSGFWAKYEDGYLTKKGVHELSGIYH